MTATPRFAGNITGREIWDQDRKDDNGGGTQAEQVCLYSSLHTNVSDAEKARMPEVTKQTKGILVFLFL